IEVIDDSFLFKGLLPDAKNIRFDYPDISKEVAESTFFDTDYDIILWIPKNVLGGSSGISIIYKNRVPNATQEYIRSTFSKMMYDLILAKNNVDRNVIRDAETSSKIKVMLKQKFENGKEKPTLTDVNYGIGFASGFLIYFFIIFFGVQVMRGVMEEKTSRIVEVILSSVKPFQLMMGKIIGIAMVGLTQFLIWVILTFSLYTVANATILKDVDIKQVQQREEVIRTSADLDYKTMKKEGYKDINDTMKILNDLAEIDVVSILLCFVFYFIGGYLIYASLYAAVGAAIDSESDTQQFVMPITIPLLFSFAIAQYAIQNPSSSVSMWFSIIPFTSPVVMMMRLPFGVPGWQLAISMILLVATFLFTTWIAGRVYRTGILMYGKKVSWKELGKWLFYKG
ncbi:MAG TPA: ABC transporter permease, partial [Bacteroidia bacterium]|nr:ABC transporter permease [Bacteroidia bacterium]